MNDHIRKEVRIAMIRAGVTQTELANKLGLSRQHLNHLLTGHRGKLPDAWGKLFDELGLELTVKPKHEEKDA